eukprot:scaffold23684_cov69-Phaeocystis_antarctica.AAC.10
MRDTGRACAVRPSGDVLKFRGRTSSCGRSALPRRGDTVCESRGRSTRHRGATEHRRRRVSSLLAWRCSPLSLEP